MSIFASLLLSLIVAQDGAARHTPSRAPDVRETHPRLKFDASDHALADVFFAVLSPHGRWAVVEDLGLVWQPNPSEVGEGFVPFVTGGKWMRGPEGWQFENQYEWGGIAFRYGTWMQNFDGRWMWVPGARRTARDSFGLPTHSRWDFEQDPRLVPPPVRTIKHPNGASFAYPYGPEWGRRFPPGTELRLPPGDVGSKGEHNVLVPERSLDQPVYRWQSIPVYLPPPPPASETGVPEGTKPR